MTGREQSFYTGAAPPATMIRAVIFDMDGVLVDSERHWRPEMIAACRRFLPDWGEADEEAITGGGLPVIEAHLRSRGARFSHEELSRLLDEAAARVYAAAPLSPGAAETIAALRAAGLAVALASSSQRSWVERALAGKRLLFDALLCAEDVARTKPAPDLYLAAAERLGLPPAECAAVEDAAKGVAAAKAAGMACIAYRTGVNREQDLSAADEEIRELGSLPGIVAGTL